MDHVLPIQQCWSIKFRMNQNHGKSKGLDTERHASTTYLRSRLAKCRCKRVLNVSRRLMHVFAYATGQTYSRAVDGLVGG